MGQAVMQERKLRRYFRVFGVARQEVSYAALDALDKAQVSRVPFENVSKLSAWKLRGVGGLPSLGEYLQGIERHNFGGTCYISNYFFWLLLHNLKEEARLYGAEMNYPDVHLVIMVQVD
jgi:arylamine N-acetyltransferase